MLLAERLRSTREHGARTVRVRVRGGYQPSVLHGRVGEPLRVVFAREETAACSEHVVFPAFGKSAMLPPFEEVTLELVPERAGEYEFTCQFGMLKGRLVVDDADERSTAPDSARAKRSGRRPTGGVAREHEDTAVLAFLAWLCSLPLVLLVSVPFLGWRAGGALALLSLGVVTATCFAVCARRLATARARRASRRTQVHSAL
jgi:hypothetical protein